MQKYWMVVEPGDQWPSLVLTVVSGAVILLQFVHSTHSQTHIVIHIYTHVQTHTHMQMHTHTSWPFR